MDIEPTQQDMLRAYQAPWKGELLLVCNKCRRKLKKHKTSKSLSNLKKWFKKRSKREEGSPEVRVVGIDCVKMCPKAGLTVIRQHQLCDAGREVSILRSEADLEALYTIVTSTPV